MSHSIYTSGLRLMPENIPLSEGQSIPVINDETMRLFTKIAPKIPETELLLKEIRPIDQTLTRLINIDKQIVSIEGDKKILVDQEEHEFSSKVGILLMVSSLVFAIAMPYLFPPITAALLSLLFLSAYFDGSYNLSLEYAKNMEAHDFGITDQNEINKRDRFPLNAFIGYLIYFDRVLNREERMNKKIEELQNETVNNFAHLKSYFNENYATLKASLEKKLTENRADLAKTNTLIRPPADHQRALSNEICSLQTALTQLESAKMYYNK